MFIVFYAFGWIDIIGFSWTINDLSGYLYGAAYIIISMLSVSFMEEVFIRGYLFQITKRRFGLLVTVIVTSLIFGILNIGNPTGTTWGIYVIPVTLSLVGLLFAQSLLVYQSLWAAIGLHFAWNTFLYGVFNLNGGAWSLLFVTEIEGPAVFAGIPNSSFGPEVSILGVVVMF